MKKIFALITAVVVSLAVAETALHFTRHARFLNPIYKKNYKQLYTLAPNASYPFTHVTARTNSKGTRGEEFSAVKPADSYRIISLGDSITFGTGLTDTQTYPYLLGRLFSGYPLSKGRKIEVINMGVGGYCIVYGIVHLKANSLRFNPDLITIGFSGANESRLDRVSAVRRLKDWDSIFGRSVLVTLLRNSIRRNMHLCEKIVPLEDYQRLLQETVDTARKDNKKMLFIIFPWRAQVYPYDSDADVLTKYTEALQKEKDGRPDRSLYYEALAHSSMTDIRRRGIRTKNIGPFLKEYLKGGIYSMKNDNALVEKLNTEALVLYRQGDYTAAAEKLSKSLAVSGTYPMTHYYLGVVYADMGDANKMNEEFDKSVELSKSAFLQYQTAMRKAARANGVAVADIMILFQTVHKNGLFIDKIHHSPEGARLTAEEIKRIIVENKLID